MGRRDESAGGEADRADDLLAQEPHFSWRSNSESP
jgi:hypothetical protein